MSDNHESVRDQDPLRWEIHSLYRQFVDVRVARRSKRLPRNEDETAALEQIEQEAHDEWRRLYPEASKVIWPKLAEVTR